MRHVEQRGNHFRYLHRTGFPSQSGKRHAYGHVQARSEQERVRGDYVDGGRRHFGSGIAYGAQRGYRRESKLHGKRAKRLPEQRRELVAFRGGLQRNSVRHALERDDCERYLQRPGDGAQSGDGDAYRGFDCRRDENGCGNDNCQHGLNQH